MGQTLYAVIGIGMMMFLSVTFATQQNAQVRASLHKEVSTHTASAAVTVLESIKGKQFEADESTSVYPIPVSTKSCALLNGDDYTCSQVDDYNGAAGYFTIPLKPGEHFTIQAQISVEYLNDDMTVASAVTDTKRVTAVAIDSTNYLHSPITISRIIHN